MVDQIINSIQDKFNTDSRIRCLYINYISDNFIDMHAIVDIKPSLLLNKYLDFILSIATIIHYELLEDELIVYYENTIFLKIKFTLTNNINKNVKVVFNKDNLNIPSNDALTNNELIKNLNKYYYHLIEYIEAKKQKDSICLFHKMTKVLDTFIVIYRAFFDSYNAKKEYNLLKKTMDKHNYSNLESILKKIKFDNSYESILMITSIVDQLIKNLPLSLLNDIDIGFYNFIKNQLYALN